MEIRRDDTMPWHVGAFIGIGAVTLLAVALILSYYVDDEKNRLIIIGAIITNATTVVNWMFGSSKGSQQKDATISAFGSALATSMPGTPMPPMTTVAAPEAVEIPGIGGGSPPDDTPVNHHSV